MSAAHAKVNLWLDVLAREASGFHQIETLFCGLALHDELTLEAGPSGIDLTVSGADVGPVEANLVHRAAVAFTQAAGVEPAWRFRLTKNIPAGGGLGGGSSDAALALRLLNEHTGRPLDAARLAQIAAGLGSDVPFFLHGLPCALAWSRGERLLRLPAPPSAPVLLLIPPFPIPTGEAYRHLAESRGDRSPEPRIALEPAALADWTALAGSARNDFEPVAFALRPELAELHMHLRATGPILALLAGSGSTLFAVYPTDEARDRAAERVAGTAPADVMIVATRTLG